VGHKSFGFHIGGVCTQLVGGVFFRRFERGFGTPYASGFGSRTCGDVDAPAKESSPLTGASDRIDYARGVWPRVPGIGVLAPTLASLRRRVSPASPVSPARPTSPHKPVLSLWWLLLSASPPWATVVVVDDGGGEFGAVALATPAAPNKSAPVAAVIARVLRMTNLQVSGQWLGKRRQRQLGPLA
jgi:hypothetical protein